MKYLGRKRNAIYFIIFAAIITTATRLYVPVVIGRIVNSIQEKNFNVLSYYIELILILAVISSIATFIVNFGAQYASQHYAYNLRRKFLVASISMVVFESRSPEVLPWKKEISFFVRLSTTFLLRLYA